ncbi:MAG: hypothetical protein IJN83_02420 [Clostridia bacterium]|nr:hypothetical protein [Clostridia bacterium]
MDRIKERITDTALTYGQRVLRDVLTCGEMKYDTLRLYAREEVPAKNVQKAVKRMVNAGLLKIAGKGPTKALRYVYSKDNNAKVAELYGEAILEQFLRATNELHYTTSSNLYKNKQQRRWRMGEVCAMLDSLGCPLWRDGAPPGGLTAYSSTEIRQACGDTNLAANSRVAAELVSEAAAYTVYSIGPTLQRWNREAERRGKRAIELAAMQRGEQHRVSDAICFYSKDSVPAEYIRGNCRIKGTVKHRCIGIHNTADVYRSFHLIPLNIHGKAMLKLLCIPNLKDVLCDMFSLTNAAHGQMPLVCHGYNGNSAVFFTLTGDMNGLHRFLMGYAMGLSKIVVCWDWQKDMVERFIVEQGFEVTLWDYEPQSLIQEIQRRTSLWKK